MRKVWTIDDGSLYHAEVHFSLENDYVTLDIQHIANRFIPLPQLRSYPVNDRNGEICLNVSQNEDKKTYSLAITSSLTFDPIDELTLREFQLGNTFEGTKITVRPRSCDLTLIVAQKVLLAPSKHRTDAHSNLEFTHLDVDIVTAPEDTLTLKIHQIVKFCIRSPKKTSSPHVLNNQTFITSYFGTKL